MCMHNYYEIHAVLIECGIILSSIFYVKYNSILDASLLGAYALYACIIFFKSSREG